MVRNNIPIWFSGNAPLEPGSGCQTTPVPLSTLNMACGAKQRKEEKTTHTSRLHGESEKKKGDPILSIYSSRRKKKKKKERTPCMHTFDLFLGLSTHLF